MSLKKPSEYFKKDIATVNNSVRDLVKTPELNTFSDAFESFKKNLSKIEVLSEFSDTLDNYRVNIEKVNYLSEKVEDIQTEVQSLLKKEDLDRAMMSQLIVVEQSIHDVQSKVKGINEKNLTEIRLDVSGLTNSVNEFLKVEVPKYKKLVVDSEIRTNNRYEELEKNVNETLEGIGDFVDNKYQELTENLQGINEQSLASIIEDFKSLDKIVLELKEQEIPKYKGFIVETERKTESKLNEFQDKLDETVNSILEKINLIEGEKTDLIGIVNKRIQEIESVHDYVVEDLKNSENYKKQISKKVDDLEVEIVRNESHIKKQNQNLEQIQEDVRSTIQKLNIEGLEEKNYELGKKVKYLEEVFEKFNEKEILTENIAIEPPSTDNKDPLTPTNQNFITLDQLQQHYRLFINRIQQQLATIGGGGETRLEFLDDIDRDSAKINGRFLKYDAATGKWVGALGGGGESQTLDDTLGLGNTSSFGMSVGIITATSFVKSGGTSSQFLKADGSVDTSTYATQSYVDLATVGLLSSTGNGSNLTGIVTSIVAGNNITISGSTGQVTINASGGGESYWTQSGVGIVTTSNVGIATTNPTSPLTVFGDALIIGIVTATDFNSASDIRLKNNISVIDNPLDKITKLEGVNFEWRETGKKSLGVIAQDVEKVLPELVSGEESKTVNYNGLIGLLIECVKYQQKEIEQLRKVIDK